ncbi:MAG: dihydrodipicolinate synthase family protein, partial [bacterium]
RVKVLSGNDTWTLALLALGGSGVISVVANIVPRLMARLVGEFLAGNAKKAKNLHYRLLPLMKAMELEVNPVPVKTAMVMLGMIEGGVRQPLSAMEPANVKTLRAVLKKHKLVK